MTAPYSGDRLATEMGPLERQQVGELREQLAEALYGLEDISEEWPWAEVPELHRAGFVRRADAFIPVVTAYAERQARARAAEELRAAATAALVMHDPAAPDCVEWADWLDARADALAADDRTDRS